jgi:hypothetical protein
MYNETSEYLDFLRRKDVVISTESYRPVEEPVLNPELDWLNIYNTYLKDNLVVVDNYLSDTYAARLREFVLFCNKKEDFYLDYAAINFYRDLPGRIWFPLLTEIVDQTKNRFALLRDLKFIRGWSFIYNNNSEGVNIHADDASINLNYWVTPNESLYLNEGCNGLDIWKIGPPKDWSYGSYNRSPDLCKKYLQEHGAKPTSIAYSFNRLVIFNSMFFHKTQPVKAKPGYENRRINYTFLYR